MMFRFLFLHGNKQYYHAAGFRWCRIVNVNDIIEIRSLVSRAPKTSKLEQWHRVGRPSVAIHR